MASIAGYTFMSAHGPDPKLSGSRLGDITRPGTAGAAFWEIGYRAKPFNVTTRTACASDAAIVAAITAYTALEGNKVTYIDDKGNVWVNLLVHEVTPLRSFYLFGSNLPIHTVLECEWTLEHVF